VTKTQKIIVLSAVVLIIAAVLYPPYYRVRHAVTRNYDTTIESGGGWEWIFEVNKISQNYATESSRDYVRFDILGLEIFGILVLAGAALLIAKHK
jgi:hypothetical protein